MRVLLIGSGGREHALAWKINRSPRLKKLYAAPGNPGIGEIAECLAADTADVRAIAALAESINADLTVIGPEAPLVAGVAEAFADRGLRVVAPSGKAALLEGSKIFAKQFMQRQSIPTARFTVCESPETARAAFESFSLPVVVKADGLAAGKGVRIAQDREEFEGAVDTMMVDRVFGDAGTRLVIEECLVGREASLMLFTDGRDFRIIAPAQDYKRVDDEDQGPNTGGMGSFSTPGLIDDMLLSRITREIVEPTLDGMAKETAQFAGVLYVGLMLTADGPRVIEYNVRFGDPETQSVLVRLDSDLLDIFESVVERHISEQQPVWSSDSSVCVVAASKGYPGIFESGKPIEGLDQAKLVDGVEVFHAGTKKDETGRLLTAGGRVLGITARAASLEQARANAYEAVSRINFENIHYRRDIGRL